MAASVRRRAPFGLEVRRQQARDPLHPRTHLRAHDGAHDAAKERAVTQLVASLERQGLVERVRDPDDGRGVIVRPTLASNEGYERSRDRLAEMEGRWRDLVGPRRWDTFRAVLHEVADALERPAEEPLGSSACSATSRSV